MAITANTIGGASTSTTAPLPAATTIDAVQDYLAIYTNSLTAAQGINRNTLLGVSAPMGLTETQSASNKTFSSTTLTAPVINGNITGTYTLAGTPTFPSSVMTLTGTQTATNKTFTSPTITSPTITNATISSDVITGFTTSNAGTIYGIGISGGNTISTALTLSSLLTLSNGLTLSGGTLTLPNNSITAPMLSTTAITLGYAQITGNLTTSSSSFVYATGLGVSVTVPAGGRRIKITVYLATLSTSAAASPTIGIFSGATVGTLTTPLQQFNGINSASLANGACMVWSGIPSAGTIAYSVGMNNGSSGTATLSASSTSPGFILVEMI